MAKATNYDMMKRIEELEAKTEDTGWVKATLTDKFKVYSSEDDNPEYRKIGKQVYIRGAVSPTAIIEGSSSPTIIFNLPAGFRPSKTITFICQGSGTNKWVLGVYSDGRVGAARYSNNTTSNDIPASAWLVFYANYAID